MKVIVFDDELCRQQQGYALAGLELSFYEHADDAVDVVREERPDLVCMDFSMNAERSGAEAVVQLRVHFGGRRAGRGEHLRIIAISSDPHANERMLAAGADDAVPKTHLRAYLRRLRDRLELERRLR